MLALSPDQFEDSSNFKPLPQVRNSKHVRNAIDKFDYAITNAGLSIRLPLFRVGGFEGLYAAFLACSESERLFPSAVLLSTSDQTPENHFWRTNSNLGPIERDSSPWLPIEDRRQIAAEDVYILPRFTSVSVDNIEPPWKRASVRRIAQNASLWAKTRDISFTLNKSIVANLEHIPDPSFTQLESAQQLRRMMMTNQPTQIFQELGRRPNLSQLLPRRQPNFCGRDSVLSKLREVLCGTLMSTLSRVASKDVTSCVMSGFGGVGKTCTASQFSHFSYEHKLFHEVIWINAESKDAISSSFRRYAIELGLIEQNAPKESATREVLHWLCNSFDSSRIGSPNKPTCQQWLLVLDNATSISLLHDVWPSAGFGSVLITSRDPTIGFDFASKALVLDPFTKSEAMDLLTRLTGANHGAAAVSVLDRLGGLPLAIVHAAGYIVHSGLSFEEFLKTIERGITSNNSKWNQSSLDTVWALALTSLPSSSLAILRVVALLNPDFISDSVLLPLQTASTTSYPQTLYEIIDARKSLFRSSLIHRSITPPGISVHRLIQNFVKIKMEEKDFRDTVSTTISLLHSAWRNADPNRPGNGSVSTAEKELILHIVRLEGSMAERKYSLEDDTSNSEFFDLLSFVQQASKSNADE